MNILFIAIGGALGSVARYLFSSLVLRLSGSLFPVGTFAVNLAGCVAFGLIMGAAQQRFVLTPEARSFLLIGVLGGFTTFSSFAYGAHNRIHTAKLLELSQDLPIVIEIVEASDAIEAFLPDLDRMVGDGLVTLERAEVLLYRPGRS